MHLTLLKHQNTKTSLYKLSKNHWVIALFKFFGSVRKKLQLTVSLKHPVTLFCSEIQFVLIYVHLGEKILSVYKMTIMRHAMTMFMTMTMAMSSRQKTIDNLNL